MTTPSPSERAHGGEADGLSEEEKRGEFCEELGQHLAGAMEAMGIEDADMSDGRLLADTVYCLGYRRPADEDGLRATGCDWCPHCIAERAEQEDGDD